HAVVAPARPFRRRFGGWRKDLGGARGSLGRRFRFRCRRSPLGFLGLALELFRRLLSGILFLTSTLDFQARLLFGVALGLRLLELAQGILALGLEHLALVLDNAALDVRTLLPDLDVHRLAVRTALARIDGDLADRPAFQGHLPGGAVFAGALALAVIAAQETQQLDLFLAADRLLRVGELHAGFLKLREQLVDRRGQHCGQLLDCYVRHSLSTPDLPANIPPHRTSASGLPRDGRSATDQVSRAYIINS